MRTGFVSKEHGANRHRDFRSTVEPGRSQRPDGTAGGRRGRLEAGRSGLRPGHSPGDRRDPRPPSHPRRLRRRRDRDRARDVRSDSGGHGHGIGPGADGARRRSGCDRRLSGRRLAFGVGLSALLVASAAPVGRFLGDPQVGTMVAVGGLTFAICSIGSTSQAVFMREMRFRSIELRYWFAIAPLRASSRWSQPALVRARGRWYCSRSSC